MYDSYADHSSLGPTSIGYDHSTMSMSRLTIYSDLFEEVIERDRVFGSLLRKIKTAYESVLGQGGHADGVPDLPDGPLGLEQSSGMGQSYDGLHSNVPTTRAEDSLQAKEMIRENRVLKDLVERLHLELEETVKREHRWKQKVVKLKTHPADHHSVMELRVHEVDEPLGMQAHAANSKKFHASRREPGMQGSTQGVDLENDDLHQYHTTQHPSVHGSPYMEGAEGMLNQGGILSMSSISPQNSAPPHPESMLCASQLESARSTDSVPLPQKPDRRRVIRPGHVPSLDLTRLAQALEEEEEAEDGEIVGEEGVMYVHHDGHHQDEDMEEGDDELAEDERATYALQAQQMYADPDDPRLQQMYNDAYQHEDGKSESGEED